MLATGLIAALAAAFCFNVGVALQALEARDAPAERSMRLSLLAALARRPRWAVGIVLAGLGVALQVAAFADAPFVVVQAALATGLLVLLFAGGRLLHEHIGVRELAGVLAMIGGIALIAWGAPGRVESPRNLWLAVAVVGSLSLLASLPFVWRRRRLPAMVVILGAAIAVAASNIATKLMAEHLGHREIAPAAPWLVVAAVTGLAGLVGNMSALQRNPATRVVPISFAVQTFVPIVLGPIFLSERLGSAQLDGLPLVSGLLLTLAGILAVASARAVAAVAERS
jgi:drug/metabolite transporter (DMT)-like permease